MKHTQRAFATAVAFGLLLLPSAVIAEGVSGIRLQAQPNAILVEWDAPRTMQNVDHYKVYYSAQSILQNNGRYDDVVETFGDERSVMIFDLSNRGFVQGDTIFVTVTAVDTDGAEYKQFTQESSKAVNILSTHSAAGISMEHAIAESSVVVRVRFSAPVTLPKDSAASFLIRNDQTGTEVAVESATVEGNDVVVHTAPMTARARYSISATQTVKGADGTALNAEKMSAIFIARGESAAEPAPVPLEPTPVPTTTSGTQPSPPHTPSPAPAPDTTPPEDISHLVLQKTLQADGNYTVQASWKGSLNSAKDLHSYHLYESKDRGRNFVGPTALLSTVTSTTIANVPPGTLTVKVTALDTHDNESQGVQETIVLPETGPALILMLSVAGAGIFSLKRSKRDNKIVA